MLRFATGSNARRTWGASGMAFALGVGADNLCADSHDMVERCSGSEAGDRSSLNSDVDVVMHAGDFAVGADDTVLESAL